MELESKRCRIRLFRDSDIDAFMSYRNNQDWMKYQGFKGLSKETYQEVLLRETTLSQGQQFAIALKNTDQLIGDIYLRQEADFCWIGYSIHPDFAQKGYIQEVVIEVMKVLKQNGFRQIRAGILVGNLASKNLIKKLGFTFVGHDSNEEIYKLKL